MAESFIENGPAARTGGDRDQLVVNVDEDVLTDNAPDGVCELDRGPRLAPEAVCRPGMPVPRLWPTGVRRRTFITASTFLVDGGISGAYVTPQ